MCVYPTVLGHPAHLVITHPKGRLELFKAKDLSKSRSRGVIVFCIEKGLQRERAEIQEPGSVLPHGHEGDEQVFNVLRPVVNTQEDTQDGGVSRMIKSVTRKVQEADKAKENQLGPGSTADKVNKLMEKLQSLSAIVNTIDKIAQVTSYHFSILTVPTYRTQMNRWVDLAWQLCSSLFKVQCPSHGISTKSQFERNIGYQKAELHRSKGYPAR